MCSQEELVRCHDEFNNQMTVLQHKLAEKGMNYETSDIAAVLNLQVPFVISAGVCSLYLHFQGHLKNNMLVQNMDPNLVASIFNLMRSSQDEVTFMRMRAVMRNMAPPKPSTAIDKADRVIRYLVNALRR